jgi:hypothetical protein
VIILTRYGRTKIQVQLQRRRHLETWQGFTPANVHENYDISNTTENTLHEAGLGQDDHNVIGRRIEFIFLNLILTELMHNLDLRR